MLEFWPSVEALHVTGVFTVVVQFFFPLAVLCFSYGGMALALRHSVS